MSGDPLDYDRLKRDIREAIIDGADYYNFIDRNDSA